MALVSLADLHAPSTLHPSQRVYQRVGARIHDDAHLIMPPLASLNEADLKTLDTWIASGAPGGPACQVVTDKGRDRPLPPCARPDEELAPAHPIPIPAEVDTLVCYGVDVPVASKRHVTALGARIDNFELLHHVTLFLASTSFGTTPTSDPTECGPNGQLGWRIASVWTPGAQPIVLPPEAGLPEEGTMHYVVQVHYRNPNHLAGHVDTSGYSLCTTANLRPNDADVVVFGTQDFLIPARASLDLTCRYKIPTELAGRAMINSMPHMHGLGKSISTTLLPESGAKPDDLGTRDPWTPEYQYWKPIQAVTHLGDTVATRCAWENPTNEPITFGEISPHEMCASFTLYYPKAPSGWSWAQPSQSSICQPTP